ncbi:LysR substrate-binding domain-containing protein [Prauserella sp. PE36]|uniref:LysR substrate-binding domain-containing protein n=1 Tax=Prauserella sp. PE36 TaxID=1504709 RepID=UPI001F397784|nr:LysR substrate-binding domain-containing protein [Prauserella sp. PE36]
MPAELYDVRRLRLLRELSQHGTIAATARACSLTPSAVSQQLSLLEREVGSRLLVRDGRTLVLTEAARVLVEHTEGILAGLEAARAGVAELASSVSGVLRLAAFPTAARALVPGAIARCRAEHPDLRVRLTELPMPEAVAAVKAGHVDLALVYGYSLLPKLRDPGVETVPLLREPLLAALPAGLDDGEGPLPLARLADEPWIAADRDDDLHELLRRACGVAGFVPRLDFTSSDYTVIFALVEAGLGVSLVPRLAFESLSADVVLREVSEPSVERTVSVAVRAGSARQPPVAAVLAALRRIAAEAGGYA